MGDNTQATTMSGRPLGDKTNSLTVGPRGPTLLQDVAFLEEIAHFDRERIPERVVHAKGNGAFGYFQLTDDQHINKYCKAALFQGPTGHETPIAVRFSTVGGEKGSADTVRDPRGFAIKFYTSEGNLDIVGNNTPIFFVRDPMQFPSLVHSQKRHPQTNLKDPNAFWDFLSLRPESLHQTLFLFSDRGIPDGYRFMHGFGSHAFKTVNQNDEHFYVKFHFKTNQGIKNMDPKRAEVLAGEDPDYAGRDLFESIEKGDYPSWRFCFQVMTPAQAEACEFNPFDITKTWPHAQYPLLDIGYIILNKNPSNFFSEMEQIAFCPANLVPGIEPSPDKLLQGRLFSYSDAQRYRLGANFHHLPVNKPQCPIMNPTYRDGAHVYTDNNSGQPNYFPNSMQLNKLQHNPQKIEHREMLAGEIYRHDSSDHDNYSQAAVFWNRVLKAPERERLSNNMALHLRKAKPFIQERMLHNLYQISPELGRMISKKVEQQ